MILTSLIGMTAFIQLDPRTLCGFCVRGMEIESCVEINWELKVVNCEVVESVAGHVRAFAAATFSINEVMHNSCFPYQLLSSNFQSGFWDEPDRQGQVVAGGFAQAAASSNSIGCDCEAAVTVDFTGLNQPYCYIRGSSAGGIHLSSGHYYTADGGRSIGYGTYSEAASAYSAAIVVIEVNDELEVEYDLVVDWEGGFTPYDDCPEFSRGTTGGIDIEYAGQETVLTVVNTSASTVEILRGIIAAGTTGDVLALGLFDHPGILVDIGLDGSFEVSGKLQSGFKASAAGIYEVTHEMRRFGTVLGDFNGDGEILESDYDVAIGAVGCQFGDPCYFASVDFDLDGEITQAESERALDILDQIVGSFFCAPDLNKDGLLNFFDLALFVSWLNNSDPRADWNGDTLINFFDLNAYLADYNIGCFGG